MTPDAWARVFRRSARQIIATIRARRALGLPDRNELSELRWTLHMRRQFSAEAEFARGAGGDPMIIVYRIEETPDGRWLLFRQLGAEPERPVLRSGSTVKAARFPTRRMVLDAYEAQRKADVRAGTRIGVAVRVRIEPYP